MCVCVCACVFSFHLVTLLFVFLACLWIARFEVQIGNEKGVKGELKDIVTLQISVLHENTQTGWFLLQISVLHDNPKTLGVPLQILSSQPTDTGVPLQICLFHENPKTLLPLWISLLNEKLNFVIIFLCIFQD